MNAKRVLLLSAVAIGLLALAFGCSFGLTIQGRVDQFLADLNAASRDQLYLNLDPSLHDYNSLKASSYWDGWFPLVGVDTPYFLSGQVTDNPGTGTATVTADIDGPGGFSGPWQIVIGLKQVGFDWMIESMTLAGDNVIPYNWPPP